ncbi:MAG: sigma-70 family RNA polymerase sigma factor [Planctomycetaceae bacterium]|jgi:RNA polymerase sigma-70 factor, ECF subfamily|nr:MAG: sigma-70 family RNA polymerase sigma factor [Planctomycetaceae bacterium]
MPSDEELMLAVGKGDLNAFGEIVFRHQHSAWNIAYRFLGNETDAEDVAQEAFFKLLDAAEHYRPTALFRTYLHCIVTRLCLDWVAKKQPLYTSKLPEALDPGHTASEKLIFVERDLAVRKALYKLPPNQRMAIVLKYYEGIGYREIAATMEVTEKAVERLLARGRASLEEYLRNFLEK